MEGGIGRRTDGASGGGGRARLAALAHLSLHHHLPGNAGDLPVGDHALDPRLLLSLLRQGRHPRLVLFPKEEAGPPVSRVLLGKTWVVRDDLPTVL